jgi:molybdenum cofactor biosynthesis protein MoaC
MQNSFKMIDVGAKPTTNRLAAACGEIYVGAEAFGLIKSRELPKGDALLLAEIAGIQGAKKAYEMMPLCHPMSLDAVKIITELDETNFAVRVFCIAKTLAKTGVEMEALAGVNAALLTIWDLTKMVEPNLMIGAVRLLVKFGGKSGKWLSPDGVPEWLLDAVLPKPKRVLENRKIAVLTMSDRAHIGEYEDKSGKIIIDTLKEIGAIICDYRVIPDVTESIVVAMQEICEDHAPHVIICTGGTGVAKRDVTPEALSPLFDKTIDGVGELLRNDGAKFTPLSWSSRAVAGTIGDTLVITLPGSPRAVSEGLGALLPALLPHLIRIINGEQA